MKLYLETDDGVKHPITEIKGVGKGSSDILFFMCKNAIKKETCVIVENVLSEKTNRECILILPFISSIFGVDNNAPKMMD